MRQPIQLFVIVGILSCAALGDEPNLAPPTAKSRQGFTTLFDGKDFTGWHGQKTMDPRQFEALSSEEKSKVLAEGAEDMKKHWRVRRRRDRQRRPGCLSHDRQRLRRRRAPGRLQDRSAGG